MILIGTKENEENQKMEKGEGWRQDPTLKSSESKKDLSEAKLGIKLEIQKAFFNARGLPFHDLFFWFKPTISLFSFKVRLKMNLKHLLDFGLV